MARLFRFDIENLGARDREGGGSSSGAHGLETTGDVHSHALGLTPPGPFLEENTVQSQGVLAVADGFELGVRGSEIQILDHLVGR
jgi:hypothetical protein